MNNQSKRDFAWYHGPSKPVSSQRMAYPTTRTTFRPTNLTAKSYNEILHNSTGSIRQNYVQQPTVINVETKHYAAPEIISVQRYPAQQQQQQQQQSQSQSYLSQSDNAKVFYNPTYVSKSEVSEQLASETSSSASDLKIDSLRSTFQEEEEQPLLESFSKSSDAVYSEESDILRPTLEESDTGALSEGVESSIKTLKRNSVKLDELSFLDGDIENGAQFDDNVADLVDLEYKGDASKDNSFFFDDVTDIILDNDKWNFYYSRKTPKYIEEMEEQERMERSARGLDGVFLGRWHHVQQEFMAKKAESILASWRSGLASGAETVVEYAKEAASDVKEAVYDAKESIQETISESVADVKESIKETFSESTTDVNKSDQEANSELLGDVNKFSPESYSDSVSDETFSESTRLFSSVTGVLHSFTESAYDLVDSAKAQLGIYKPGSIASINALEEKERLSRMNQKVDPVIDAKKRHVELELMSAIKKSC